MFNLFRRRAQKAIVVCPACNTRAVAFNDVYEIRETELRNDLSRVTLHCKHCGDITHVCFDSPALKAEKARLQELLAQYRATVNEKTFKTYQDARQVYARHFEEHNKQWAQQLEVETNFCKVS